MTGSFLLIFIIEFQITGWLALGRSLWSAPWVGGAWWWSQEEVGEDGDDNGVLVGAVSAEVRHLGFHH